jgi:DNA modification methylase
MTTHTINRVTIHEGDCLQSLRAMPDESVHCVVTDPPYGLSFMGKRWDYDVPAVEVWQECWRVMKPGGYLLAFAGTRTQHRMAVRIEDAGFEIRDMIAWVYGSGFSKGFNLKRAGTCKCGGNAIAYNHPRKEGSDGESTTEHELPAMRKTDLPQAECDGEEQDALLQSHLQQSATGLQSDAQTRGGGKANTENARPEQSGMEGWSVHRAGEGLPHDPQAEASAGKIERLRSGAHRSGRGDAWQATEERRGGSSHQPQPGGQQAGEFAGVCQSPGTLDAGALHGRGQCPQCGKLKAEFDGWSSNLKPALEPITVARKALCGTVAENVLQHGTGGINVDGCRVEAVGGRPLIISHGDGFGSGERVTTYGNGFSGSRHGGTTTTGRWPANLIHDGSDEVVGLFPETETHTIGKALSAGRVEKTQPQGNAYGAYQASIYRSDYADAGSAARFFYCAKADASERRNSKHPTVKPLALMRYLCRLVCPPDGIVLDPFCGSGTTLEAARLEGFGAIGCELNPEYIADCKERLKQGVLF